jgi:hypothetical protein
MTFRKTKTLAPTLCIAGVMILGACSYGNVGPAENQAEASMRDATRFLESSRRPFQTENLDRVRTSNEIWTGSVARRNDRGAPLPRRWEGPQGFVLKRATPMQLFEIGSAVTEITGIPVNFSADVLPPVTGAGAPAAPGAPPGAPGAAGGDLNALLSGMGIGPGPVAAPPGLAGNASNVAGGVIRPVASTRMAMRVDFEGRLSQFLNQVSAHFGTGWEYIGGEIRVFRNQTKTFTVQALPSSIQLTSALTADNSTGSAGGGGGGGGGGQGATANSMSNQRVNTSMNIQIWDDITRSVQSIVDNQGRVNASVSTGTITVTAPPSIMSRVQEYLNGMNEYLGKQVTVGITVLSVELNDGDNNVVDVGGLLNQAGRFGIALGTPSGVASGTAAIATLASNAVEVVQSNGATPLLSGISQNPLASSANAGGGVGFNVANPGSRWNGTNAIVQALSTRGRVSVRTTTSVTTLNGVPAPVQVANTRGYVQSVAVSDAAATGGVGNTTRTTIQTSTLTTGFSSSILPRIDADSSSVLLQYSINLSELVGSVNGFDTFTSPDNRASVQLPNVNSRNFVQQARVPNGATLVLTGFEQNSNRADRTGSFGDPTFLGLGGRQVGQRGRTAIVILMTPTVVTQEVIRAE